jgi:hypothetical protein
MVSVGDVGGVYGVGGAGLVGRLSGRGIPICFIYSFCPIGTG